MGVNKSNFITRTVFPMLAFPSLQNLLDNTVSFEQGDLLFFDDAADLVKKVTAEADSATFLGISQVTVVDGKVKSPYTTDVDASQAINSVAGPIAGVVALMEAKGADAFNPGDKVGIDAANLGRGVSSTITTKAVGIYQGPAIGSATQGQLIECLMLCPFMSVE